MSEKGSIESAFDDFMRSFEAFKSENDKRLRELERNSYPSLLAERDRLREALESIQLDCETNSRIWKACEKALKDSNQ